MARKRRSFTREFKIAAVKMVTEKGHRISAVARDLDIGENLLRRWKRQFTEDPQEAFPGHGKMKDTEEELRRLKRENARLREERDILKKTVGYFAGDDD